MWTFYGWLLQQNPYNFHGLGNGKAGLGIRSLIFRQAARNEGMVALSVGNTETEPTKKCRWLVPKYQIEVSLANICILLNCS